MGSCGKLSRSSTPDARKCRLTGDGVGTATRVGAGDIEPLEGDGWVDEVVSEPLPTLSVVGLDSNAIVNRESRPWPGQQAGGGVPEPIAALPTSCAELSATGRWRSRVRGWRSR